MIVPGQDLRRSIAMRGKAGRIIAAAGSGAAAACAAGATAAIGGREPIAPAGGQCRAVCGFASARGRAAFGLAAAGRTASCAHTASASRAAGSCRAESSAFVAGRCRFLSLAARALKTEDAAKTEWLKLQRQNSDVLGKLSLSVSRVDLGARGTYYRIQAGPVADEGKAAQDCAALKSRNARLHSREAVSARDEAGHLRLRRPRCSRRASGSSSATPIRSASSSLRAIARPRRRSSDLSRNCASWSAAPLRRSSSIRKAAEVAATEAAVFSGLSAGGETRRARRLARTKSRVARSAADRRRSRPARHHSGLRAGARSAVSGADPVIGDRAWVSEPRIRGGKRPRGLRWVNGGRRAAGDQAYSRPRPRDGRQPPRTPRWWIHRAKCSNLTDFAPFRALSGMPWAMTAHVLYTAIDPDRPATLSPRVIADVIRAGIGFDGVLLCDDLSMAALGGKIETRAWDALQAGCDLVLHCNGILDEMGDRRRDRADERSREPPCCGGRSTPSRAWFFFRSHGDRA